MAPTSVTSTKVNLWVTRTGSKSTPCLLQLERQHFEGVCFDIVFFNFACTLPITLFSSQYQNTTLWNSYCWELSSRCLNIANWLPTLSCGIKNFTLNYFMIIKTAKHINKLLFQHTKRSHRIIRWQSALTLINFSMSNVTMSKLDSVRELVHIKQRFKWRWLHKLIRRRLTCNWCTC